MAATVPLVALKKHPYGKRTTHAGRNLRGIRAGRGHRWCSSASRSAPTRAPHPEQPIAKPTPPPKPTPPIAEVPPPEPTPLPMDAEARADDHEAKRGTYRRRDLTAEGDE